MEYAGVKDAVFLERPNRFIARCLVDGAETLAHVPNTGRCAELLRPGCRVWLAPGKNPARKTKWTLVSVEKGALFINMDSAAPNRVVGEALAAGALSVWGEKATRVHPEAVLGDSRFDFYIETPGGAGYLEVKGCTLEREGVCLFPDAPTLRGLRHVTELTALARQGVRAGVLLVVQMNRALYFTPNRETQPAFADALKDAALAGVEVRAFLCHAAPGTLSLGEELAVRL